MLSAGGCVVRRRARHRTVLLTHRANRLLPAQASQRVRDIGNLNVPQPIAATEWPPRDPLR